MSSPDNNQRNRQIKDWLRPARDDSRAPGEGYNAQGGETPCQFDQRRGEEMTLKGALKRLPEDHHEVIWLRRHEQRSFEEIAARRGRTEAAARKLWLRALERLKQELKPGP